MRTKILWGVGLALFAAGIGYVVWASRRDATVARPAVTPTDPAPAGPARGGGTDEVTYRLRTQELGIDSCSTMIDPLDRDAVKARVAKMPDDFRRVLGRELTADDVRRIEAESFADWTQRGREVRRLLDEHAGGRLDRDGLAAKCDELMAGVGEAFRKTAGITAEEQDKLTKAELEAAGEAGGR